MPVGVLAAEKYQQFLEAPYNPFKDKREVMLPFQTEADTVIKKVEITDQSGNVKVSYSGNDLAQASYDGNGHHIKLIPTFYIDPEQNLTMKVDLESKVAPNNREAFVTNNTILGYYEMTVKISKNLRSKLNVHMDSLSYEPVPESHNSDEIKTGKLTGPVFPGGGFLVDWKYE